MAQYDCIGPMKLAMKIRRDTIGLACEALMKMFQLGEDDLVEQVLENEHDTGLGVPLSWDMNFEMFFTSRNMFLSYLSAFMDRLTSLWMCHMILRGYKKYWRYYFGS